MKDKRNNQQFIMMIGCEIVLVLCWWIYFTKFTSYYLQTEILISDSQPLIDKLVIFVSYAINQSVIYFSTGFLLVFLLVGMSGWAYKIMGIFDVRLKISCLIIIMGLNASLIWLLYKPMIYPIYVLFTLMAVAISYTYYAFRHVSRIDKENDQEDDEERYEENDDDKTTN